MDQNKCYPWQADIWDKWQQLLDQSRMGHAILLSGAKGSGRSALITLLAKTYLCKNSLTEPCELCQSCQLVSAGTHPDLHWVQPEAEGKSIGIDAIRRINKYAIETSQLGAERVIIITNADKMGEAGANALLKTLEEPPEKCRFILLTESIDALLPTIVSRCNTWKIGLPHEEIVKKWVEAQLKHSVSLQTIRLNRGAPLLAKAFVENGGKAIHQALFDGFSSFIAHQTDPFAFIDSFPKETAQALHWLSFILLDVIKLQQGSKEAIIHCDSMEALVRLSRCISLEKALDQLIALNKLNANLAKRTGLNAPLLISAWLLDF